MKFWLIGWSIFTVLFIIGVIYYASKRIICPGCGTDPCMCDHFNCSNMNCKYFSVNSFANCDASVLEQMKEVGCPHA